MLVTNDKHLHKARKSNNMTIMWNYVKNLTHVDFAVSSLNARSDANKAKTFSRTDITTN